MKQIRQALILAIMALVLLGIVPKARTCLVPPCGKLVHWFYGGDATVDYPRTAVLGDAVQWSYLYAFYQANPGLYRVEFDFQPDLSLPTSDRPPFFWPDTFSSAVFFRNDPSPQGSDTSWDITPLFDMDASNTSMHTGTLGSSPLGSDWMHFSTVVQNHYHYMAAMFKLIDGDFISADSHVTISNICISQVPIPSSLLLLGTGLVWVLARRRNSRHLRPTEHVRRIET